MQLKQYVADAREAGRAVQVVLAGSKDHVTNEAPSRQAIGVNERSLHFDHLVIESAQLCKTWFVELHEFFLHFISEAKARKAINKMFDNCKFPFLKMQNIKKHTALAYNKELDLLF